MHGIRNLLGFFCEQRYKHRLTIFFCSYLLYAFNVIQNIHVGTGAANKTKKQRRNRKGKKKKKQQQNHIHSFTHKLWKNRSKKAQSIVKLNGTKSLNGIEKHITIFSEFNELKKVRNREATEFKHIFRSFTIHIANTILYIIKTNSTLLLRPTIKWNMN